MSLGGMTQYVDFSDWLLALSNVHLSFSHVFAWLVNSYLSVLNDIPLSGYAPVCPSIHLLIDLLVASGFWQL